MNLKSIDEIKSEIDEQIRIRQHLITHELVGTLYPAILNSEIIKLRKMKNESDT